VRLDGERLFVLGPPFTSRIPAVKGAHVVGLYRRGEGEPLAEVHFRVRSAARAY
jgi:hypothetical protein